MSAPRHGAGALVAMFLFGLAIGNLVGDQATIKDCASKGVANMAGGGTVKCEVERATTKGHP